MLAQYLAVSRAASRIFFEQFLDLESLPELVDGCCCDAAEVCVQLLVYSFVARFC